MNDNGWNHTQNKNIEDFFENQNLNLKIYMISYIYIYLLISYIYVLCSLKKYAVDAHW